MRTGRRLSLRESKASSSSSQIADYDYLKAGITDREQSSVGGGAKSLKKDG